MDSILSWVRKYQLPKIGFGYMPALSGLLLLHVLDVKM